VRDLVVTAFAHQTHGQLGDEASADAVSDPHGLFDPVRGGRLDPQVQDEIVRLLQRPHGLRMRGTVDIVGTRTDVPDSVALREAAPERVYERSRIARAAGELDCLLAQSAASVARQLRAEGTSVVIVVKWLHRLGRRVRALSLPPRGAAYRERMIRIAAACRSA